jgi:hypothetical protein
MNSVWQKSRDFPKIDVHEFHLRLKIKGETVSPCAFPRNRSNITVCAVIQDYTRTSICTDEIQPLNEFRAEIKETVNILQVSMRGTIKRFFDV